IKSKNNYVFVASGRGGLKILKMNETSDDDTSGDATAACADATNYVSYTGGDWMNLNSNEHKDYKGSVSVQGLNVNAGAVLNFSGSLQVNQYANVNSNGLYNHCGALVVMEGLNVNSTTNVYGSLTVYKQLNINSNAELYVKGSLAQGALAQNQSMMVNGTLLIEGNATIYGNLTINSGGKIKFVTPDSTVKVYGTITNNGEVQNGSLQKIN
ncbi:hypothetical protein ACG2LH_17380, partial [Zhouia sp. PK063]